MDQSQHVSPDVAESELHEEYRVLLACFVVAASSFLVVWLFQPFGYGVHDFVQWGKERVYWPVHGQFRNLLFTWGFVIALSAALIFERWLPTNPRQGLFCTSFWHDFVWFFYEGVLQALVLTVYVGAFTALYHRYFDFLTIRSAAEWPLMIRLIVGVLAADFLFWVQHWLNHKVPWLWYLHMVHHSQKNMTFFTDFRYHVLEYVVRNTVVAFPFLILSFETPAVIGLAFFVKWYGRFYHGNIRSNFGPLRYVLVTPQSHRVHHSIEAKHTDKNFGSLFTFWDYLFGTQYKGWDEYPDTGIIGEPDFPHENKLRLSSLISKPIQQMIYPLKLMARDVKSKLYRGQPADLKRDLLPVTQPPEL